MASLNDGSAVEHLEEECVLSLLALKQNRSVTPELNANTGGHAGTATPRTTEIEASPLPVPTQLTYLENNLNEFTATQPIRQMPRMGLHAAAPNDSEASHANKQTVPIQTALSVEPKRPVPLFPNNLKGRTMHEASMTASPLLRTTVVPILPSGWEPDQDFDDKTPDLPLLPNHPEIEIDILLGGSPLVKKQDRNLVPDAVFIAMAQMQPCRLTVADQTGSYRKLEVGFVGFCCKHCGGQPGFGRYFPSTQRSCAQTTSSQTILKHIDSKCRYVPTYLRTIVHELERIQQQKEINHELGRPRYGARKVFFERVWKRLHEHSFPDDEPATTEQSETPPSAYGTTEGEFASYSLQLHGFGSLSTKKNVQSRMMGLDGSNKRARVST